MRPVRCRLSSRPPVLTSSAHLLQRHRVRRPERLDGLWCSAIRKEPQEPQQPQSPGHRSSQELQAKAKLLRERQKQVEAELQQLQIEAENLSEADQELIQAQLSTQENAESQMPEPVRDLFAEAGVLNAFPNERPSGIDDSDSYFRTPGDAQSYDWDLKMITLEDVADPITGDSEEDEEKSEGSGPADEDEDDDDEGESAGSNEEVEAGEGVEEMLRLLEEGGALPDIEGLMDAEDPEEFQMRVQKLINRYEAQFQKKKDRKISTEEIREMEREEAWQPTKGVPVIDEDILEVRPAPALPADIQQQYDALQQCLYVLRRAHTSGRADEPVKALASAGLVDMAGLQFDDPLLACRGLEPWLLYMESLSTTGAWIEVEHLWAEVSEDRPNPVYTIMVDHFVNLPFPEWYYAELQDSVPASAWDPKTGALRMPALFAVHESAPDDPSVPLQQAHPRPQNPTPGEPPPSQPNSRSTRPVKQKAKRASNASSQQDKSTSSSGSATADADGSDGGSSSSSSSHDATGSSGWGFKTARPPGYRQTQAQAPDGQQRGSVGAEEEGPGSQEWPCLWYFPEQFIGIERDREFADEQRLVAEQILQQMQQQGSEDAEVANQVAQETSPADAEFWAASEIRELLSDSARQSAEQEMQQPAVSLPESGAQGADDSGFLPQLDLLAQFGESDGPKDDHASQALDDAHAAKGSAAPVDTAGFTPAGFSQDTVVPEGRTVVNLNGAQVLTPEGWQSLPSKTPLGTAWEQGNCLTIGMTLQYHMSASSGKITAVTCGWAALDAFAWSVQDMMNLYIRCTGLYKW